MNLLISEIIQKVQETENLDEKIQILRNHKSRTVLRDLLIVSYDPRVKILVPDTDPPFSESTMEKGMNSPMDTFIRQFRLFIEGKGYDNLKQPKREMKFIEICESLHKDDARVFLDAFHKRLRLDGITPVHIKEIWNYDIPMDIYEDEVPSVVNTQEEPTEKVVTDVPVDQEKPKPKSKRSTGSRRKRTSTTKKESQNENAGSDS